MNKDMAVNKISIGEALSPHYQYGMESRHPATLKNLLLLAINEAKADSSVRQTVISANVHQLRDLATHYVLRSVGLRITEDEISGISSKLSEDIRLADDLSPNQRLYKALAENYGYIVTTI